MKLLIDADIILYRIAFRHQTEMFGEYIPGNLEDALADVDLLLMDIQEATGVEDYVFCFSSFHNFRKDLIQSYKAFRKKYKKPALLAPLRAKMVANYPTLIWENIEADDVMGILATREPGKYVICSTDKDLKQIPGLHFNWRYLEQGINTGVFEVSEEEGWRYFYRQILSGDPADGYKGVPGIGPKKAEKLIKDAPLDELWDIVVETYKAHDLTYEDALNTARLAFILRDGYYNKETGEVKLWEPRKEELDGFETI